MHLQRRSITTSSYASFDLMFVGAVVGAVCAVALVAGLLTLALRRRRQGAHSRHPSMEERLAHSYKDGMSSSSDYGSPINLRATAAFQNIWQSVDLGRNSLPQNMILKPGDPASSGLQQILASMNPPQNTNGMHSNSNSTDSSGSSTAVGSKESGARRDSFRRGSMDLMDGYAAAQGGFDPDARPLTPSAFSLHHGSQHHDDEEEEEEEEDGCDLGEMAVVVVAGGEEVSQVLEGMQLSEFYVSREEEGVVRMEGYDVAPSPLYTEFSHGDAW